MTYGFRPENWPVFQAELQKRGIAVSDIEKVEIRPSTDADVVAEGRDRLVSVIVTLRSGRAESWDNLKRRPDDPAAAAAGGSGHRRWTRLVKFLRDDGG